jgi:hypothetical protein
MTGLSLPRAGRATIDPRREEQKGSPMRHAHAKATTAAKIGDALFYLGFFTGIAAAGGLFYLEVKDMQRSLFDQLASDSGVTLSLIAAFLVPLGVGWLLRYLIAGKRWS